MAAGDLAGEGQQVQQRQGERALAAAALADDGQHLAGLQVEADVLDGADDALLGEEGGAEVLDAEDGLGHRALPGDDERAQEAAPSPVSITALGMRGWSSMRHRLAVTCANARRLTSFRPATPPVPGAAISRTATLVGLC